VFASVEKARANIKYAAGAFDDLRQGYSIAKRVFEYARGVYDPSYGTSLGRNRVHFHDEH